MKPYTVLLLYPDYLNDNYDDTFLAYVKAENPEGAVDVAQRACSNAYSAKDDAEEDRPDPNAFAPLVVFAGHLEDLNP